MMSQMSRLTPIPSGTFPLGNLYKRDFSLQVCIFQQHMPDMELQNTQLGNNKQFH